MKKLTVRLDDYVYDRLSLVSKEEKITINKLVNLILKKEIDKPKEFNLFESINENIKELEKNIVKLSKKQYFHFQLSLQHFVNQGYFENANPKEDKCYLELEKKYKDYYNE